MMEKVNTGLKDRKGNQIFGGDIVLRHRNDVPVVEQIEFNGSWVLQSEDGFHPLESYNEHVEIIGDIYETPELLEN